MVENAACQPQSPAQVRTEVHNVPQLPLIQVATPSILRVRSHIHRVSVTWELVRNAGSWGHPPQTCLMRICILPRSLGELSFCALKFEKQGLATTWWQCTLTANCSLKLPVQTQRQ